ncbi:MAG: hypothetical protein MUP30_04505 [Deltaproteobacteria bacterium]|nr:hypothetical protein [Deltaproteobacteria bacterium]
MRTKRKKFSEEEIDQIVISQVDNNDAWEDPVKVMKQKATSLSLPAILASRAAFFARLHREASLEEWIKRIIRERLDIEEAAFAGCKKELSVKNNR